jgi:23S rRNA (uridine2552-2'-O)-methyltransferase
MGHRPYQHRDHYSKKAKDESFVARSVYKLEEIDKRYRILGKGDLVVDLGCAPGSWLQYASKVVGSSGRLVGIDLFPIRAALGANVTVLQRDVSKVTDAELRAALGGPADAVLCDMAPRTSGVRMVDQARSQALCDLALAVARSVLRLGGRFLVKIFQGPDTPEFVKELRRHFATVNTFKPQSSRSESMEIYAVGTGFRVSANP